MTTAAALEPRATTPDLHALLAPFNGLTEQEKRLRLAQRMEQLRRQAPERLRAHAQFVHRTDDDLPLVAARHHAKWAEILEDREQYRYVCVVAPPGYAKSTWFTLAYPTWRIGQTNGKVRIGLIANTDRLSWGWAGAIKDAVESENFRKAYPDCIPDVNRGWRHNELFFDQTPQGQNATLYAAGMNGQVQSKRFDEIILDDPTTWQDALSDTVMEKQRRWLKNTLIKRFPPGMRPPDGKGRMTVVLTRWSAMDLVPTLEELGFKIVTMPALGFWDGEMLPDGKFNYGEAPLWPEKETLEALLQMAEDDPVEFALVMQGDTSILRGDFFDRAWFKLRTPLDRWEYVRIVMAVDTASGKNRKKGDFFAACVMGRRIDGTLDILEVFRDVIPAPEQEAAIMRMLRVHQPDLLAIEDVNEGSALLQNLTALHLNQAMKGLEPVRDKEFRASPMARAYKQGLIFHAGYPDATTADNVLRPEKWAKPYTGELEAFPTGGHDDMVDAAAYAYSEIGGSGPRARAL